MAQEVRLLGEVQVFDGGERHTPPADKRLGLLGYLAYQGGGWVEREKLAFLFWPDAQNEQARTNLRGLLARCKSLPFTPQLDTEATRLRWRVECDAKAFREAVENQAWQEGIALYRGELFGNATFDGIGEFSAWLEMEREGLKESYRTAVFNRAAELKKAGRIDEAVKVLESLLGHDPLDEEAVQFVMRLLLESGRPELASKHYHNFSRRLAEKLDLKPTSATERLGEAVEEQAAEPQAASSDTDTPAQGSRPPIFAGRVAPARRGGGPPLSSFVGRELELAELTDQLGKPSRRLITLTGPGGVGKTRLALQAVEELREQYADGAHFVPLDAAPSQASVPLAIASALGIVLQGKTDPLDQVVETIADAHSLLVLDNYEQLLDGVAIPAALLEACPNLDLLVTSRERLGLSEEWLMPLKGFAYPLAEVTLEEAQAFDAVGFFCERARQVRPEFSVNVESLPHLLEICHLVDGLPLGLELAAVWVRAMPLDEIALEVRRNLDFLSGGHRNVPDRHRSIRAAFEHSWSLLTQREQVVLRKLAAFRGGFRREAAAFVAGATIPILAALIDKSLLRVSPEGRYDRHPLLYQYSAEKLAEHPNEEREARDRHASYFASISEEAGEHDYSPRQEYWLRRVETEYDNFRAALDWAESSGQAELGLRLAGSLNWFWGWRGMVSEPRQWLGRVLAIPTPHRTAARAKALRGAGLKATLQGDLELGRAFSEEALTVAREVGDWKTEILALNELADVGFYGGDYDSAEKLFSQGLEVAREHSYEAGISSSLAELGILYTSLGRLDEARAALEESLALSRKLGDKMGASIRVMFLSRVLVAQGDVAGGRSLLLESLAVAREVQHMFLKGNSLYSLGLLACDQGEYEQARSYLRESLEVWWQGGMTWRVGQTLEGAAALETVDGEPQRAAVLWGAAEALREARSTYLPPFEQQRHDHYVAQAKCSVDGPAWEAAWEQGRGMVMKQAVEFALNSLGDRRRASSTR